MTIKAFYFSQPADLRIEGIGIHASYSINLIINDENIATEKKVLISATGKSNAAKAAGSGTLLFWCKVTNSLNNKVYILERKRGKSFAIGIDDVAIGSTLITMSGNIYSTPQIVIEAGYFYESGYTGAVPPFPASIKRVIS
ncbi:hypothetical protein QDZ16_004303, partial [Pluralibacter gergoviae]|nr:hypothetical protein [Pluralibacter gergoviae]